MGVDYNANYGIGYQVKGSDDIPEDQLEYGLAEYLYGKLGDEFEHFEVGEGNYTGEENDIYIVVKSAFKDGLDLTAKKKALDEEIKRLKLEPVGKFGDVGGLYVW
jgi:hypothetical protein